MVKRQHSFTTSRISPELAAAAPALRPAAISVASISLSLLAQYAEMWVIDTQIAQSTERTVEIYRTVSDKLLWYLTEKLNVTQCGPMEIRRFFLYLERGHKEEGGRWASEEDGPDAPARYGHKDELSSRTVYFYFSTLRTLFNYLVAQGVLPESPFNTIPVPKLAKHQIQPFTQAMVKDMLAAAWKGTTSLRVRDRLIILLLLDTGIRATELCNVKMGDIDLTSRRITVLGKGEKRRTLYYGQDTSRALHIYLRIAGAPKANADYLITSQRGTSTGQPLTRNGLFQLISRLGESANVPEAIRCSPHTFRHTFSIEFLRNGGNVFTLKELLGHNSLAIVNQYLAIAEADLEKQHRQFSPVDQMRKK